MFEPSGANAVSLDGAQIADLAQLLLELSHLPFQAFDAIESVVNAGVFYGLQPGEDGRERATDVCPALGPEGSLCLSSEPGL